MCLHLTWRQTKGTTWATSKYISAQSLGTLFPSTFYIDFPLCNSFCHQHLSGAKAVNSQLPAARNRTWSCFSPAALMFICLSAAPFKASQHILLIRATFSTAPSPHYHGFKRGYAEATELGQHKPHIFTGDRSHPSNDEFVLLVLTLLNSPVKFLIM